MSDRARRILNLALEEANKPQEGNQLPSCSGLQRIVDYDDSGSDYSSITCNSTGMLTSERTLLDISNYTVAYTESVAEPITNEINETGSLFETQPAPNNSGK